MAIHNTTSFELLASAAYANTTFANSSNRIVKEYLQGLLVLEVTQATGTNPKLDLILESEEGGDYFRNPDFPVSEIATDFEAITVSTTALNLTAAKLDVAIPPTSALVNIEAQPVNYRIDGGVATAAAGGGMHLLADKEITLIGNELRAFSVIRTGATNATANVTYRTSLVRVDCKDAGNNNVLMAFPIGNMGERIRVKYRIGGTASPTVTFSLRLVVKS